jgi:hypothetical protein
MTDELIKLLENPALRLMESIVAARMQLMGIEWGDDWGIPPPKIHPEFDPELIRRLAGG